MYQILVKYKFAVEIFDTSHTWDRADPWRALLPVALVPQRCVPPSQGKGSALGTIATVKCHSRLLTRMFILYLFQHKPSQDQSVVGPTDPKERDKESYKKECHEALMMMMMM